jgi:pyruvate kinase
MRRHRNAKIIATLGPATSEAGAIRALFEAGADVFRLNFSHGTHAEHAERHRLVRSIEKETGRPIGVLMDVQGPKLRIGCFAEGPILLKNGARFRLDLSDEPGNTERAPLPHPEIFRVLSPGTELMLDDGRLRLQVNSCDEEHAETTVLAGGELSDHKGVNVPNVLLPLAALTAKDRSDLEFGLNLGIDWVGLSFVQRPEDVAEARKLVAGRAALIAKIEKPAAIEQLDEIIELADALMIARGDLGVEMRPEEVPPLQKKIVAACRRAGKPVVVATQMLESMVHSPRPTRAEASDVATAVYDGADALMLSTETAAGEYSVESVDMMDRIIRRVEGDATYRQIVEVARPAPEETAADAISAAARQVAHTVSAAAIVTYTTSGSTALRASRERPDVPILGFTSRIETARRLSLAWGIHCIHTEDVHRTADMVDKACRLAAREGFAEPGARLVITAGMPFGTPGATNLLRIAWVRQS